MVTLIVLSFTIYVIVLEKQHAFARNAKLSLMKSHLRVAFFVIAYILYWYERENLSIPLCIAYQVPGTRFVMKAYHG